MQPRPYCAFTARPLQWTRTLQTLRLRDTKVTDVGLAHLKGLTKLRFLDLGKTAVTDAGIKELQKALPKAKIAR